MKKAVQILLLSAFLLTFMITKSINVMQDTEIWKDVPGYFGKVQASSLGRIKSFYGEKNVGKIRKPQKGLRGKYHRVQLQRYTNSTSVHRLVALAWHDNPNNYPVVMHIDDNGLNNNPSNLQWATQAKNIQLGPRGKNVKFPTLHKQVMREAYKAGFSKLSIAKYFRITDTSVRRVVTL